METRERDSERVATCENGVVDLIGGSMIYRSVPKELMEAK